MKALAQIRHYVKYKRHWLVLKRKVDAILSFTVITHLACTIVYCTCGTNMPYDILSRALDGTERLPVNAGVVAVPVD